MYYIAGKSGVEYRYVVILRLPCFLTDHGGEAVFADRTIIGQIVLEGPVGAGILLRTCLVLLYVVVSEMHCGVESLTMSPSEIPTKFSMPGHVLNRCDIEEDVTSQFLTFQSNIVEQRHGDWVGAGESLFAH